MTEWPDCCDTGATVPKVRQASVEWDGSIPLSVGLMSDVVPDLVCSGGAQSR